MKDDTNMADVPDPAALAFDALRREVALLHSAIAGLAAERAAIPDYSETLGEIVNRLGVTANRIKRLEASTALGLTPPEIARQIEAAGTEGRWQELGALGQARDALEQTAANLKGWIETARRANVQNLRLLQVGGGALACGAVLGAILWGTVPSFVVHHAPQSWAWPEKRAAGSLHLDMWSAGEPMMRLADPDRWRLVVADSTVMEARRIQEEAAKAAEKPQDRNAPKRMSRS